MVIRVLVVASSAVVRAGLESLARATNGVHVVGSCTASDEPARHAAELEADVVLADANGQTTELVHSLIGVPVVLLAGDSAMPLVRAGARAVLPHGVSSREIGIALQGAAAGLIVIHPDGLDGPAATEGPLTNREVEVLRMIADGLANKEIAYRLGISEHTVKFHIGSLFQKLDAGSRTEAVTVGLRMGLILL